MKSIKELTKEEALSLLENAKDGYINSGSSRAVYEVMYESHHCVLKVAADKQGRFQNDQEMEVWNSTNSCYLARIYASFQNIFLVMEYIEPFNYDLRENVSDGCLFDYEMDKEDIENIEDYYGYSIESLQLDAAELNDAAEWLTEYVGYTSDNYQGGRNDDDECKLYDYGYNSGYSNSVQVGDVSSCSDPLQKAKEEVEMGEPYEDEEWEEEEDD